MHRLDGDAPVAGSRSRVHYGSEDGLLYFLRKAPPTGYLVTGSHSWNIHCSPLQRGIPMNIKNFFSMLREAFADFLEDKAPRLGAALSFYTIFSIAPLLLIAIGMAGVVFGDEAAQGEIVSTIGGLVGEKGAKAIEEMIETADRERGAGAMATIVGLVMLLFGASGVFGQLKDALNTIWEVEPKKGGGIGTLIKDRFLSFAMVFGVGFLLLVSLVLSAALAAMGKFLSASLPGGAGLWQVINLVVSFGVVTFLFAVMFKVLPDIRIEWRDVWIGAAFTSALFVLGKFAIGLYLGKSSATSVCRRVSGGDPDLDLLLGSDPLFRRRVHPGLRQGSRLASGGPVASADAEEDSPRRAADAVC